jgi:hypothetical protein
MASPTGSHTKAAEGMVKVESVKPPKPAADPASLHKKMMQLMSSLWVTHAIGSFARLGLADAMEAGGDSAEALAKARGLVPDRVYRLLRALSTCGIVTEAAGGRFALTPLGRMLTSDAPNSMRTSAELLTEYNGEIWSRLDGALAGGIAFEALKGQQLFDWLHANPKEGARFQRMMVEVHSPETPAIVAAYDFGQFKRIVDVGGGHGMLLSAILAAHPNVQGTLFDLQEGIEAARRGAGGPLPGVSFIAGDVFEFVPEGADAYLFRHLLHDYDDDDCIKMLNNEAGLPRAGAGKDRADRRHAGPRPLARSACHAPDRRTRAHRSGIRDAVRQSGPEAQPRAADRASGGRGDRSGRRARAAALRHALPHECRRVLSAAWPEGFRA